MLSREILGNPGAYPAGYETMSTDFYEENWQTARAEAKAAGLRIIEHGWEQHVIIDEANALVYRYPRRSSAAARLEDEVAVLHSVNQQSWPIALPIMRDHTPAYTSYTYIPGEVYEPATRATFSQTDAERLGQSLGTFLAQFHALDHGVVEQKKTKHTTSLLEYYEQRIRSVSGVLGSDMPGLTAAQYQTAVQNLESLLEQSHPYEHVVVHGDLHGFNMVIDPAAKTLTGVIDLSEMEIGEPHQDFRKLFMADERMLDAALAAYQAAGGTALEAETVKTWAYVNEWSNLCHFADQPNHPTYQRAHNHLQQWQQL